MLWPLLARGGELRGENPQIRRAGVEVQVQGRTADRHRLDVLRVVLSRVGNHGAVVSSSSL